jgi:hypothetical protein
VARWLAEIGPPLARFYPGLPDIRRMSPAQIAPYIYWRWRALSDDEG